jgi:hypothetical protein
LSGGGHPSGAPSGQSGSLETALLALERTSLGFWIGEHNRPRGISNVQTLFKSSLLLGFSCLSFIRFDSTAEGNGIVRSFYGTARSVFWRMNIFTITT